MKIYQSQALQATLAEIITPVQVIYLALDQPEADTMAALADLTALTPYLSFNTYPNPGGEADRLIVRSSNGRNLVFVGGPIGTELAALVSAVVVAGRGDSGLSPETRQTLADLPGPVQLQVFTTPT